MSMSWKKYLACAASVALMASAVPMAVITATAESADPAVPSASSAVTGWQYKMIEDHEDEELGTSYSNWGSYCKNAGDAVMADVGADGTKGLLVGTKGEMTDKGYCQPFYYYGVNDQDFTGATEIWVWLDMTKYQSPEKLSIRPRLCINGSNCDITMKSGAAFYMQDGEGWKTCHFMELKEADGESHIQAADLEGFKGYLRLPFASFNGMSEGKIQGLVGGYWIFNMAFVTDDMENNVPNNYVLDNMLLAGPTVVGGTDVKALFDGSLAPDAGGVTPEMEAAAKAAKDAIAALPALDKLTLKDEAAVTAAREKVKAVDEKAMGLVDNLPALVSAEKKIQELKDADAAAQADKAAAKKVQDTIAALKEVAQIKPADEDAVVQARKAYDALSDAQKKLVTNLERLEAAEKAIAAFNNRSPEDPNPDWNYLSVVDFDFLKDGYNFNSEKDEQNKCKYMLDPCGTKGKKYGSFITNNGYKGSSAYTMKIIGEDGNYAQPLLRLDKLNGDKVPDYTGAEEFVMYVDFTHIKMDSVGLEIRLIVNDKAADGTPSGQLTQYALKKGGYVYMLSSGGNWVKATTENAKKLPTVVSGRAKQPKGDSFPNGAAEVAGYKGFIRIPLSQMENISGEASDVNGKMDLDGVAQLWMVFNCPEKQDGNFFVLDQIGFDGNFTTAGQGEVSVLEYLPMSSGGKEPDANNKGDSTGNDNKVPATGAAAPVAMAMLGAGALTACLGLRKKSKKN